MKSRKHRGLPAMILGLLLMIAGAALLLSLRSGLMQYIIAAPQATPGEDTLTPLYEEAQQQLTSISDSLSAYGIGARAQTQTIEAAGGQSVETVLYAVGEGYFDVVYERTLSGQLITPADVKKSAAAIVLDESTALTLFAGDEAVGQEVTLAGTSFEVVGVIRGGRRIGERDAHVAYIPITTAGKLGVAMQTVELCAIGTGSLSSAILMQDTLAAWQSGSFYSYDKLKLGAVMPLRWALLAFGIVLLLNLLARLNVRTGARIRSYAAALKTRYARDMLPEMLGRAALALAGYAALAAALYLLARFAIAPLYVFTDWVPEVLVELSSLISRFWSLNDAGASAIRYASRALGQLELGRDLVRWGLFALLLGLALHGIPWLNRKVKLPEREEEGE